VTALLYVLPTQFLCLSQECHNKRLGNPRSNPGQGKRIFCCSKRSVSEAHLLPVQLLSETKTMGVQLNSHLHLLSRLRRSGAKPPLPHMSGCREQITRYLFASTARTNQLLPAITERSVLSYDAFHY
jgi:hypothetical protein